ncbi:tRNA (adenosine(37)-N6)-threonylcarbamoyltransferase complex dimerization subunit type 1 TsaB [Azospirillum griseum]|uniref:N(6)-L-threonylcarbamoyladenine synthase n=1 Tax=Azospirillum griseum TaxID=2496639 RepID=A0A3S0KWN3_9PROT|nr:tRNA (adenosine(37)-N6)-threonylcarbamoyltransferase complex dimerization subunit type 1 TsaB [Azospirillum griseum]RTR17790.1 tRNA (adenosine(37)-N6)-threonylcarbamoyltransferase complex dimerization subunit type 1 TsaB [Azospirillum griseum]
MKILGLDTATSGCSAALWRDEGPEDGRVVARRNPPMARGQAEALVPMAHAVMTDAGVAFADLDRIAVTVGPGAFTGLRIALAAARGFAVAYGCPVVGVTSFEAILHGLPEDERAGRAVLVAVDSRRAEPYLQLFAPDRSPIGDAAMLEPADVPAWLDGLWPTGPLLLAGDGAGLLRAALAVRTDLAVASGDGVPDAAVVARLGAEREPGHPVDPFYLRPPDVSLPKAKA